MRQLRMDFLQISGLQPCDQLPRRYLRNAIRPKDAHVLSVGCRLFPAGNRAAFICEDDHLEALICTLSHFYLGLIIDFSVVEAGPETPFIYFQF